MSADPYRIYVSFGRCRSGNRWFWSATGYGPDAPRHCDDPVCEPGLTGHEYGWEDDEPAALTAMHAAAERIGGIPLFRDRAGRGQPAGRASHAAAALKKINAARRNARTPRPGAAETAPVEFLYQPYSWWSDGDDHYSGVNTLQIVKKTAKRVYYDKSDSHDRYEGVITLGFVDRAALEADTRCRDVLCVRDIDSGVVCGPHGRDFPHCVHFGTPWNEQDRFHARNYMCAQVCPADVPGWHCGEHGFSWDHCPHGSAPGECSHGLPAGAIRLPGATTYNSGSIVFTTLEAAEEWLRGKPIEPDKDLKALKQAMADAHPDRGGTPEEFIAARRRYERARATTEGTIES